MRVFIEFVELINLYFPTVLLFNMFDKPINASTITSGGVFYTNFSEWT